jgi:hypothetical protein
MEKHTKAPGNAELAFLAELAQPSDRRRFLRWGGITLAVAAIGCSTEGTVAPTAVGGTAQPAIDPGYPTVNLGTGDVGILNYAYALEQLEAAFYTLVIGRPNFGTTFSAAEQQVLSDVQKHEVIHRNFFRDAIPAAVRIPELEVTFGGLNFDDRTAVLTTARTFEDLGVSAYNGAGQLLTNLDYLVIAGKIVSVEARHAAAIRDLIAPKTAAFAGDDVVDPQGLDVARVPTQVLPLADPFILTNIDASGLPTAPAIPQMGA